MLKHKSLHTPALPIHESIDQRQLLVSSNNPEGFQDLFNLHDLPLEVIGSKSCENLIGAVSLPVGCAGPVTFEYNNASSEVYVPLATTEGALVASVNRGMKILRLAKTTKVLVEKRGISRAPVFRCTSGDDAQKLLQWLEKNQPHLKKLAESTSSHLTYLGQTSWIRGRHIYVRFSYDTDQAMGMNMATIATQKICEYLCKEVSDVQLISLSSNVCTDKKDSVMNMLYGRGYWVQAECVIPVSLVKDLLKVQPADLIQTHIQKNLIGSNVAGSLSQNAHVANVLAALYSATGQDLAHVVDGSRAALTIEKDRKDNIYVALTLPSVLVGTVGGGTYLPAQTQARKVIGHGKDVSSDFLAAVVGVSALAGEISLMASLTQHTLSSAHQTLGRS